MLNKANQYQAQHTDRSHRPVYHFSVPIGWLNDPNGFSIYQGRVHLFYQYYPYGVDWSYMHWGHAVSDDMVFWDDLPVAMAPDQEYDSAGCFSGTSLEVNGQQLLIYTGVAGDFGEDGVPHGAQQQCLAIGDGLRYAKSEVNPVIPTAMLPDGWLAQDFRDPKIWRVDGHYRLAAAAAKPDGLGAILIYDSPDLVSWELKGTLLENDGEYGTMWECPDVFSLDGVDVALVSIIAMAPGHSNIHANNPVLAFLGRADWDKIHFSDDSVQQVDAGRDFYAPQTLLTDDGRRIMIGWMQDGFNRMVPPDQNWQGMMTFPRELSVSDGRLMQWPAREIEKAYGSSLHLDDFEVSGETAIEGLAGRSLDLSLSLRELTGSFFRLRFAVGPHSEISLAWEPESATMTFDRTSQHGGSRRDRIPAQRFRVPDTGELSLRILLDRNSIEVFLNGGAQVFTAIYYAPEEADGIWLDTDGTATVSLDSHEITREAAVH